MWRNNDQIYTDHLEIYYDYGGGKKVKDSSRIRSQKKLNQGFFSNDALFHFYQQQTLVRSIILIYKHGTFDIITKNL